GNIEFLGRIDQQVKIRGFRIELEEIERVLLKHPKVIEALVVVNENAYNDKRLVAYIVPSKTENIVNEVRSFLQEKLPNYMLPSNLIPMEEFKLTSNGKIDRSTLITPDKLVVNEHYIAPRTPVEELLVEVWKEVLHVSQICIRDNFFELGGHSLLITKIILRIQREIDIKIPVKTFFENPTIESLSAFLEEKLLQEYDEANE
ncbi:non-ribosomal peptide synthetase, partial [Bacillus wiedmannii]|uniref:phosphopantetheine-binding protein n=1 Tax=Bacillus wiedmannii TaxID=1890302 RepID=UPI000BFAC3F9